MWYMYMYKLFIMGLRAGIARVCADHCRAMDCELRVHVTSVGVQALKLDYIQYWYFTTEGVAEIRTRSSVVKIAHYVRSECTCMSNSVGTVPLFNFRRFNSLPMPCHVTNTVPKFPTQKNLRYMLRPKDLTPRFFPTNKTPIGGNEGSSSPKTQL